MITDVPGLRVGHWTDAAARTGCTVVLFPEGTVASGEVRGGAPATRETALLDPTKVVTRLDALVLTGGSVFGLAAADGVARFCEERGMGVPTPGGAVPIVVALALFDLAVGDSTVRPGPTEGYAACESATSGPVTLGTVGGGTGATVGGGSREASRRAGGLVSATARTGDLVVSVLIAVNAFGAPGVGTSDDPPTGAALLGNTTVGLVATNATLDKVDCFLVSQSAHDGLARSVFPSHTRYDGDAFVTAAVGPVPASVDLVRPLATHAVGTAIRRLV